MKLAAFLLFAGAWTFSIAASAPAEARGLVADENFPVTLISPASTCGLGSACAVSIPFAGTSIYVYNDGAISIGSAPLAPTLGDLSTFGNSYIAAGLADYSAVNGLGVWDFTPAGGNELQLWWIFDVPNPASGTTGTQALFGIDLTHNGDGSFTAKIGSGAAFFTWFGSSDSISNFPGDTFDPYCDATCKAANAFDAVYGVYLPNDALLGSSFDGTNDDTNAVVTGPWSVPVTDNTSYTYPGYTLNFSLDASTSAPEPFTLSIFGAGVIGAAAMRRRKAKKS